MTQELKQRLFIGIIVFTLSFLAIILSHHPIWGFLFILLTIGMILSALLEFYHLCQPVGAPLTKLGLIAGLGYLLGIMTNSLFNHRWHIPEFVTLAFLAGGFIYFFIKGKAPLVNLALTFFGFSYIILPLSRIIPINYTIANGSFWLVYLIITTKMTDVGAYITGKKMGKKLLAPYISPKKTWEGALGGFLSALSTSLFFYILYYILLGTATPLTLIKSLILGALIGVIAQFGDLSESLLKRDSGIKDSSHIPGLGGILDLLDSLIFTTPLLYLLLVTNLI